MKWWKTQLCCRIVGALAPFSGFRAVAATLNLLSLNVFNDKFKPYANESSSPNTKLSLDPFVLNEVLFRAGQVEAASSNEPRGEWVCFSHQLVGAQASRWCNTVICSGIVPFLISLLFANISGDLNYSVHSCVTVTIVTRYFFIFLNQICHDGGGWVGLGL